VDQHDRVGQVLVDIVGAHANSGSPAVTTKEGKPSRRS
jgi:hypothetical protein